MAFCSFCGKPLQEGAAFCGNCGRPVAPTTGSSGSSSQSNKTSSSSWFDHLNDYVGNEGSKDLNWRVLFSEVTQKHTSEDAEEVFIYGTRKTTPSINQVSKDWPHPWLYSRVFLLFAVTFALLWICCSLFNNPNTVPGLIVVGSFAVPLAVLVMFMELNTWRNISFFEVMMIFFVGGCASLVATLFVNSLLGSYQMDYFGAFLTGIVEEVGKAVIVYYFLKRMDKPTILGGLLVGAAVGAGFAAFESAGYAMRFMMQNGWNTMMSIIMLRAFLAPGGHVVWAAMSGVGFVVAFKSMDEISTSVFTNTKFLRLFIIPVVLHGIWDCPLSAIGGNIPLVPIGLTVFAWVIVLILVNMGLSEVSKVQADMGKEQNNYA